MILKIYNLSINIECNPQALKSKTPILFLHGFTGNFNDWKFVENKLPENFTPIFIDLIGHGKTSSPIDVKNYTSDSQIELLKELLVKLKIQECVIVGYSMGGRLALEFTLKYPEFVSALILESTSFGIEDESERKRRIESDEKLAEQIENSNISDFIKYWYTIPLFNSLKNLPKDKFENLIKSKIASNNNIGLKNSLIGFSTGRMQNFYLFAKTINIKTLLIAGELDEKYKTTLLRADYLMPNSKLKIVNDAGHNVHLEKPEEFLKLINEFLLNI
ncbi:MAG: 2-succinyl-6-hydroxy-2,4-cyclohexadiene-1-carboxylate synthase [Ignavibacteriales bacterium]|nr:2-succinyl-6-hydroxy-2,4-cyclohexadiene-1-carboxylate synthase [Ignavibacteriales bacterium]MCB9209312.1 2-succinyl-6-hydroxy-2,4-cyclohexadiene-1-carboxylate synthase [Ignavibacteriales bacterium]